MAVPCQVESLAVQALPSSPRCSRTPLAKIPNSPSRIWTLSRTLLTLKFFDTTATLIDDITQNIEPGAAYYVDAGSLSALGTSFNGSVIATAKHLDGTTPGSIGGSAMEFDITTDGVKSFESVAVGASTIYMPSAMCGAYVQLQKTSYAIQNTSLTTATDVLVTFTPGGYTASANIGPGSKASFIGCNILPTGYVGSAVITVTSGEPPVIAIGKVAGGGLSTAFIGLTTGYATVALPYVRYAPDANYQAQTYQRTNIAVQNMGSSTIPANDITVNFTDSFGHSGTYTYPNTLAANAKFSVNPSNAGPDMVRKCRTPGCGFWWWCNH